MHTLCPHTLAEKRISLCRTFDTYVLYEEKSKECSMSMSMLEESHSYHPKVTFFLILVLHNTYFFSVIHNYFVFKRLLCVGRNVVFCIWCYVPRKKPYSKPEKVFPIFKRLCRHVTSGISTTAIISRHHFKNSTLKTSVTFT